MKAKAYIKELKKLHVWDKYVDNIISENSQSAHVTREYISRQPCPMSLAFVWRDTPEGHAYWRTICYKKNIQSVYRTRDITIGL